MLDDQEINNDLSFSADDGWAAMQRLLNSRMPVSKRNRVFSSALSFMPVIMLSVFFLMAGLQLNKYQFALPVSNSTLLPMAQKNALLQAEDKSSIAVKKIFSNKRQMNAAIETGEVDIYLPPHDVAVTPAGRVLTGSILKVAPLNELSAGIIVINQPDPVKNSSMIHGHGEKKKPAGSWEFSAGIGINLAPGKQPRLQPYPVAALKYNFGTKFFVATGLALFSPGAAEVSGVSKTIHVNDTTNNIRMYKEVSDQYQFRYADVPLYAGINLHKNISLQAGVQASYLLSRSAKKLLYPYDFSMNSVDNPSLPLVGTAAGAQEEFDVRVRKLDYRFVTAVQYHYKKVSAGIIYQHGLRSPAAGNGIGNKNHLFTLNLLYKIK